MLKKRKGLIYIATDNVLHKSYISQTKTTLQKRKSQHLNHTLNKLDKSYDSVFYKMIRMIKPENFNWTILENNIDEDILHEKRDVLY